MKIILHGYGAMGQMCSKIVPNEIEIIGIIDDCYSGELKLSYSQLQTIDYDCLIDFSHPTKVDKLLQAVEDNLHPMVIATTKLSQEQIKTLKALASKVAIFQDYNTSYGLYAVNQGVAYINNLLKKYDVEIIEHHHRLKQDSPSGTAIRLFQTVNANRQATMQTDYSKTSGKLANEIGVHSIRIGNQCGYHQVLFANQFEQVTIAHQALSKELFAQGAFEIACRLQTKQNKIYKLDDIYTEER